LVGRRHELGRVESELTRPSQALTPTVVAIHGAAGCGSSALALTAAHGVAARFPDGQVYVDLSARAEVEAPHLTGRVLRSLGHASGAEGDDVVARIRCPEESAARLRSLLHDRRVLIVLENVTEVSQVAPLVPAGPGSALLITSRPMLATLACAVHVSLGPLGLPDAITLLAMTAGRRWSAEEERWATSVVESCDRLPLVIRIAGARLASRPELSLRVLAERLGDESRRLDELAYGAVAVRARLQGTYRLLSTGADGGLMSSLYRALGSVDGQVVRAGELAALSGEPHLPRVVGGLERLVDLRLLEPGERGDYRLPALVQLHAREQQAS
jgi:hypothetical protein